MKSTSKLACLFGLGVLSGLCMLASISVASDKGVSMDFSIFSNLDTAHRARLKELYLMPSVTQETGSAQIISTTDALDIYNGLVVSEKLSGVEDGMVLVVVGGGTGNNIGGGTSYSGIAGGKQNVINSDIENAVIGGGQSNQIFSSNGVVAGGNGNKSYGGVVLGGQSNESNGGIVLGGQSNKAGENGLAMGQGAKGEAGSFVWNDDVNNPVNAGANSALIGAKNGVLIGTYTKKDGVNLVVNGAIKVGNQNYSDPKDGKIMMNGGCIYSYDGTKWHVLGKSSIGSQECNNGALDLAKTCEFGRVKIQEGDIVDVAYSAYSSTDCNSVMAENVVCDANGKMMKDGVEYKYPSCFTETTEPSKIFKM